VVRTYVLILAFAALATVAAPQALGAVLVWVFALPADSHASPPGMPYLAFISWSITILSALMVMVPSPATGLTV